MATLHGTASEYVWSQWTDNGTSSTSCSTMYNNTWDQWNTSTTTSDSTGPTTGSIVWVKWNHQPAEYDRSIEVTIENDSHTAVWKQWIDYDDVSSLEEFRERAQSTVREATKKLKEWKVPTAEKLRAEKAQQEIRRVWNKLLADEKAEERKAAENVALELLLEIIEEDEYARYKETGQLFVKGKRNDYVIKKDGGVYKIDKDKVVDFIKKKEADSKFICVHPKNRFKYPDTDNVITLKLWIENNEKKFLKIGNIHTCNSKLKDFDKVVGL